MSPDWADKPEAVPYSSLDNPQSLNLYGYVGNNPLSRADADGHQWPDTITIPVPDYAAALGILNHEQGQFLANQVTAALNSFVSDSKNAITALYNAATASSSENELPAPAAPTAPAAGEKTGEPPQLTAGREAHNNEEVRPGEEREVPTPSKTGRMDRYDADKAHIREIKPDDPRGEKAGQKQLERYKTEMEKLLEDRTRQSLQSIHHQHLNNKASHDRSSLKQL